MKVSIVIPTLNEENTIGKVIDEFKKAAPDAELVVIDKSDDRTAQVAKSRGAKVIHQTTKGKGAAVLEVLEQIDSDVYVMVDGDGTYSPDDLKKIVDPVLKDKADLVIGSRLAGDLQSGAITPLNTLGNNLINGLINLTFGSKFSDVCSGYRAFTSEFVKFVDLTSEGFDIEAEMNIKAVSHGFRVTEVPIFYGTRKGSNSKLSPLGSGYQIFQIIMLLLREYNPLVFFSTISATLFSVGLILGFFVLTEYLSTGWVTRFPTAILSTLLIIFSTQVFTIALTTDHMNRRTNNLIQILRRWK